MSKHSLKIHYINIKDLSSNSKEMSVPIKDWDTKISAMSGHSNWLLEQPILTVNKAPLKKILAVFDNKFKLPDGKSFQILSSISTIQIRFTKSIRKS